MMVALFGIELRPDIDRVAYEAHNRRMEELAREMPGFISVQSYSAADGDHVTIVRFESTAALDAWRFHPEHVEAQQKGRDSYYASYWVQVCETVREYDFQYSSDR